MVHLIDKDALVAEIKKLHGNPFYRMDIKDVLSILDTLEVIEVGVDFGNPKGDKSAKCIIDTKNLEVKEMDLKKEVETWRHNHFHGRRDKDASGEYLERSSQLDIAKHFFELGLKAQKGEEV